jgi:hypothetical protein
VVGFAVKRRPRRKRRRINPRSSFHLLQMTTRSRRNKRMMIKQLLKNQSLARIPTSTQVSFLIENVKKWKEYNVRSWDRNGWRDKRRSKVMIFRPVCDVYGCPNVDIVCNRWNNRDYILLLGWIWSPQNRWGMSKEACECFWLHGFE